MSDSTTKEYLQKHLWWLVGTFYSQGISEPEKSKIQENLQAIPGVYCAQMHQMAYFFYVNVKGNRPQTRGNNVDARHVVSAAHANVFVTDDEFLLNLLKSASAFWPFMPMGYSEFCERFPV